jgi:hypothetical protein
MSATAAPLPLVNFDFINTNAFIDPRLTFSRASVANGRATYFNPRRVMVDVGPSIPRLDHDPTTGFPRGLILEEGTTNVIFNPRHAGATGSALSTGNLPTSQTLDGTIVSGVTIVRQADQIINGMNGAVYRVSGTPSTNAVWQFRLCATDATASNGQTWSSGAYYALLGGSTANVNLQHQILSLGGAVIHGTDFTSSLSLVVGPSRKTITGAMDTGTTLIRTRLRFAVTSGLAINFDIWVGPAQTEQKPYLTSQVLNNVGTTNANCVRSTETLTGVLADFGLSGISASEFSGLVGFVSSQINVGTTKQVFLEVGDGTANEMVQLFLPTLSSGVSTPTLQVFDGGATAASMVTSGDGILPTGDTIERVYSFGVGVDSVRWAKDGAVDTDCTVPNMTNFYIGANRAGAENCNGYVSRIMLFPRNMTMQQLQRLM